MMAESQMHKESCFTTLSYADMPEGGSLIPDHMTRFLKRLRFSLDSKFGTKFRYYYAGEYGSEKYTRRPHWHVILFGLGVGYAPYIKKAWDYESEARVTVSPLVFERMRYTAKYLQKTLIKKGEEFYEDGRRKEFARMSRNPGLGKEFIVAMAAGIARMSRKSSDIKLNGCMRIGGKKFYFDRYTRDLVVSELVNMGFAHERATSILGYDDHELGLGPWRGDLRQRESEKMVRKVENQQKLRALR